MLKFLEKLISQKDEIHRECGALLRYTQDCQKQLSIVRKVLVQEKEMFEFRKVSDCIVSIDRHYIRPFGASRHDALEEVWFHYDTSSYFMLFTINI